MSDRLPSDSSSVETSRAELVRLGSARRQGIRLPTAVSDELEAGDLIRLVVDDTEYHTQIVEDTRGLLIRGAFENRRLARTSGGQNYLAEWLRELGRESGNSIEFDIVVAGEQYGVRAPGERVVYTVSQGPRSSLSSIAERLDDT